MPSLLSKQRFESARTFMETAARPLDMARFRHEFEGHPAEDVFSALTHYQNPDGGFGHGLEPDLRTSESSALCTTLACQILRSLPGGLSTKLFTSAIDYFVSTASLQHGHWRIIPRSKEPRAHAPWWIQEGREAHFEAFSLNPTAEILGYLFEAPSRVPEALLSFETRRVMDVFLSLPEIEMHQLACVLRLSQVPSLPKALVEKIRHKLDQLIPTSVATDPARWSGYCLRPLQVVDSPVSPFFPGLADAVAANLDFEISSQNEDGSWIPTWSWGESFPEEWAVARREWSGWLTLEKLLVLRNFKRIAAR